MKKIGLIINPYAGIGGKVGLKGSDGEETIALAIKKGAVLESEKKVHKALEVLKGLSEEFCIYTCPGHMGELVCKEQKLPYELLDDARTGMTSAAETVRYARMLREQEVDLLVFAGGDGTARDVLDGISNTVLSLGIPTGCKIHSGVYAINPKKAGELLREYIQGRSMKYADAEVMDIDEELFRRGIVEAKLYGYLQIIKDHRWMQQLKCGGAISEEGSVSGIARQIMEDVEADTLCIFGTGSTTGAVMKQWGLPFTLLGVDLVYQNQVIARDCTEEQLLNYLQSYPKVKLYVTVIGGQGYVFGRGNQQLSDQVIRRVGRENIQIIATKEKMESLIGKALYMDLGQEQLNEQLSGYWKVLVGYHDYVMAKVVY